MRVLVVDGANVVGSRPTGWWRDRAGAAARLHAAIAAADLGYDLVVLVLEGKARQGQPAGEHSAAEHSAAQHSAAQHNPAPDSRVRTVHAPGSGDDEIVQQVRASTAAGAEVVVVTADRLLRERVREAGGDSVGPSWLLDRTS